MKMEELNEHDKIAYKLVKECVLKAMLEGIPVMTLFPMFLDQFASAMKFSSIPKDTMQGLANVLKEAIDAALLKEGAPT